MYLENMPQHRPIAVNNMDYHRQYSAEPLAPIHQNHIARQTQKSIKPKPLPVHQSTPYSVQSASIQRRNARERNRVKAVNDGFTNLRQHIPSEVIALLTDDTSSNASSSGRSSASTRKLSKVDTLKMTVEYIRRLQEVLMTADAEAERSSYPTHMYTPNSSSSSRSSHHSSSPAPSFVSDTSSSGFSYGHSSQMQHQPQTKYEVFDSCDQKDEELLDCISWWQQQ